MIYKCKRCKGFIKSKKSKCKKWTWIRRGGQREGGLGTLF